MMCGYWTWTWECGERWVLSVLASTTNNSRNLVLNTAGLLWCTNQELELEYGLEHIVALSELHGS